MPLGNSFAILKSYTIRNIWSRIGRDINGEASEDQSGNSVAMNSTGDRVAIGAWLNNGSGSDSGHVRVYFYNGMNWEQLGQDINGEATDDRSGISVSMNSAGDRVAIGAYLNDGSGSNSGHVRVYSYNGTNWEKLGQDINGEAEGDRSGVGVSMNSAGDRVAIGADTNNGSGSNSGHVRVYSYNGTNWQQLGQDINGEAEGDNSGNSVSMNSAGDRVAIGAAYNDGSGSNSGHVRVYFYNGMNWQQLGQDINGEAGSYSGNSVSMNSAGDRVAIGAWRSNAVAGHVRVYSYNGTNWQQLGQDIIGEAARDQSGMSVSMNSAGDRVAIGADGNNGSGTFSGHVRVYSYNGTNWVQLGQDINGEAASDQSGSSVSMNSAGDRLAIGARFNNGDGNGTNSGHVRAYILI